MKSGEPWTTSEMKILQEHRSLPAKTLCEMLPGRSAQAIWQMRRNTKLYKVVNGERVGRKSFYRLAEHSKTIVECGSVAECADALGINPWQFRYMAQKARDGKTVGNYEITELFY